MTSFTPGPIFEAHLSVADRERSAEFYRRVLNFTVATHIDRRDITFLWMGARGSNLLGLWGPECPNPPISRGVSHFAMRLPLEEIAKAPQRLRQLGITPLDIGGNPTDEAVVIAWMPALSIYFKDPDGHSLEFINMLDEDPAPDLGVIRLSEWEKRKSL